MLGSDNRWIVTVRQAKPEFNLKYRGILVFFIFFYERARENGY